MGEEKTSRLGNCEVCGVAAAKYTCPKCEVKTCCLDCVNIHKKELDCDGNRNKVKFVQMKKFSNLDLQSDYILLEEATRAVEKFSKHKLVKNALRYQAHQPYYGSYNPKQRKQRNAAWRRGIDLRFLPTHFSRRKSNSIFYDEKKNSLFFSIEWIFPQAENYTHFTRRIQDTDKLAAVANQFLNEESCPEALKEKLQFYQSAGLSGVAFLMKAESVPGEKYYELDHQESVRRNLKGTVVIEYPTIYVVLKDHKYSYDITEPDESFGNSRPRNNFSHEDSNLGNESSTNNVSVKSETLSEADEHHSNTSENQSDRRSDETSRYLFLCGEIDSDSGYDNEEVEMENEYDHQNQNGHDSYATV